MRSRFALSMLALALAWPAWAQSTTNVPYFAPPEIYPIDQNIALLHAADLNGDGLNDLIIANNLRSKINLLYNRTGKTNSPATPWTPSGVNSLPPGARFRIDSLPVDEGIAAMSVADLNGDGRPDIVFYGDGKNLEIIYNEGTNGWSDPKRWNIPDGSMDPNALAVGDLNGDGRPDILLLGDNGSMYFWPQLPDRTFGEPQKIPYSGSPKAVQITDINGDGRKDLLLVDWDSQTPFRFRLQNSAGQLGPEIYFKTQPLHAYTASHLNGDSNLFVVTISESSDRAAISQFTQKPAEPLAGLSGPGNEALRRGQFQVLPLKKTDAAKRGEAWADVNGDGRPDLLIADPESGQISIYFQRPDGSLAPPETFPSLAGVSQIVVSDWNGDGRPEIFLLSRDESAVGVTQFDRKGRLPFPTLVPIEGKPLVMAVGRLKPRAKPTLCVIVDNNGKRSLVMDNADGKIRSQKLSDSFQGDPVDMAMDDVN
ncbi:MAG: VCBS repeat-containing protein, partial [Verrucomicrobia bacterium]|nr:VCBS repeat-containing protein [Verrucomicrobiota bacterium]